MQTRRGLLGILDGAHRQAREGSEARDRGGQFAERRGIPDHGGLHLLRRTLQGSEPASLSRQTFPAHIERHGRVGDAAQEGGCMGGRHRLRGVRKREGRIRPVRAERCGGQCRGRSEGKGRGRKSRHKSHLASPLGCGRSLSLHTDCGDRGRRLGQGGDRVQIFLLRQRQRLFPERQTPEDQGRVPPSGQRGRGQRSHSRDARRGHQAHQRGGRELRATRALSAFRLFLYTVRQGGSAGVGGSARHLPIFTETAVKRTLSTERTHSSGKKPSFDIHLEHLQRDHHRGGEQGAQEGSCRT